MNDKPNIVMILTDDQGAWSLGCAGNKEIRTPNIDSLAKRGVRFENFFCASPVCSPARASILTGRIPSQHGILDWLRVGNGDSKNDRKPIEYLEGMTGYTDLLVKAGYVCGQSGKWHLGATGHPQKGYSHWFTTIGGSGTYHDADAYRGTERVKTKGYLTDVITDDALSFIDERCDAKDGKPFYLNLAYTAPHSPHVDQHKKEYVDYYYNTCSFSDVRQDPRSMWSLRHPIDIQYSETFCDKSRTHLTMRDLLSGYYAAVQGVDDGVGRICAELKEKGILENTLIVYMSDNGFSCGQHGIWGKGNCTTPLNLFDTCVKVPCIFSYPGHFKEGVTVENLASAYDFMPTLLDLLGLKNPEGEKLPGRSFAPLLRCGKDEAYRDSVTVYDEYGQSRMIRTKEWKYIHRYPDGPDELYDLVHDKDELFNLLDENRFFFYGPDFIEQKAAEMRAMMESWFACYADPVRDGKDEPVMGRGQLGKLEDVHGKDAFYPAVQVEYQRSGK
jgi:arylsulfatase A-like enzyme